MRELVTAKLEDPVAWRLLGTQDNMYLMCVAM